MTENVEKTFISKKYVILKILIPCTSNDFLNVCSSLAKKASSAIKQVC